MSKKAESSAKQPTRRATGGSFKPGQSGNPGGRKKKTEADKHVEELARVSTKSALKTLVSVMESKSSPPSARVSAACAVLDRGWGRAPQTVEIGNKDKQPFEVAALTLTPEMATQYYLERVRGQVPK